MVRCPNCEMETFGTRIQYEEDGCPWCGVILVPNEPEPSVIVRPPPIQRIVTPNLTTILNTLTKIRWTDAKEELIKASQALGEKRSSDRPAVARDLICRKDVCWFHLLMEHPFHVDGVDQYHRPYRFTGTTAHRFVPFQ